MERKEGVGVEKRENERRIRKKRISDKKSEKERKKSENYKTENGRKLVMKERGKRGEKRKRDKGENLAV